MSAELKIQLRQMSPSAAEAVIGEHRVTIDRASSKGGSDMGPMGGELFLAAIAGCFMSNLLAAIRTRRSAVRNVHIEVKGAVTSLPPVFRRWTLPSLPTPRTVKSWIA